MASGPDISRKIFGGVLDYDSAGHYPGLELLNFVYCTVSERLLPDTESIKLRRQAHEFARQLVWDEEFSRNPKKREVLYDDETEVALRHLLKCLQLDIPSLTKSPTWERAHFFPYSKSLIHWDARRKSIRGQQTVSIQRRYLRGGGALAYRVLRLDPNPSRLERLRTGFEKLFPAEKETALERLAKVLLENGTQDDSPATDMIERDSKLVDDGLDDILRNGIVNILERHELSTVARVRSIMNWTAFWLILIQHRRASQSLGKEKSFIICDCGANHPQLRRASQRCLKELQSVILEAADSEAEPERLNRQARNKIRGFFWATAATIKLLNSWRGRRHFTLGIDVIETLVFASTSGTADIPFDKFIDGWLYDYCGLVIGRRSAEKSGLLESFDASIFEDNEERLAIQMKAAGLLTEYSDATRMVGMGAAR